MRDSSSQENNEELKELLKQYQYLKAGKGHSFFEEDSFERIIDYFDGVENLPNALEAAEIAMEHYPFSSSLMLRKADLLIATRKYREALELLEHAELLDSHDINLYILKTDAYLALDQQEKAVNLLESALRLFEGEEKIELLFELADVYDDYEEYDKLFDCLRLVLEQDPNNEEALHKICFWTDFTGRNEEAIRIHLKIIDEFPYNELAWFNLAAAYQGLKLYEKAIDAYKYAVVIDEKFDYAYRNMGDAYIRLRKYRDAIEVLEKVLELSRPEDVIYEAIGYCYDKLKNPAQARFYYRKTSHLRPEDSKLYYKIACTYIHEKQWSQAVKQLETALQAGGRSHPEYSLAMGECLTELGNSKDAILYFSRVVELRPKNVVGWEAIIRCMYRFGFYEQAREHANAALRLTEGKPLFVYYLSAICFALGKPKEAVILLEKAFMLAPKMLKRFIALDPSLLQKQQVIELMARYKKRK